MRTTLVLTGVAVTVLGAACDGGFSFIPGAAQVVDGFEQGVVGMRVEGSRRIIIPPELGYGSTPRYDPQTGEILIPANSTLVFDVTVTRVREIDLTP